MKCKIIFTLILVLAPVGFPYQQWRTLFQKITQESKYSGFYNMIKHSRVANLSLHYNDLTIFAPENAAIDKFHGELLENLIFYHMSVESNDIKYSNSVSLMSLDDSNPPLWITRRKNVIYINNAKVIQEKSHFFTSPGKNQILYVIDGVLDPMIRSIVPKPTAYDFLRFYHKWKTVEKVSSFASKVQLYAQEDLYKKTGGHTYFIPVDSKIDDYKLNAIDDYIIQSHVIPNQVLFTKPSEKEFIFETAANGDYIYIVLLFTVVNNKTLVKSHTVLGDSNHKRGETLAEIVVGNIPVLNGVVHLISRPLAVFDRELKPFPYLPVFYKISADPYLSKTFTVGRTTGINKLLQNESVIYTYFAPKDRAWKNVNYDNDLREILGRHIVMSTSRFSMENLLMLSKNQNGTVLYTLSGPVKFVVTKNEDGYFIGWEDKVIKVYKADYECSDGIVHVLDSAFAHELQTSESLVNSNGRSFWGRLKPMVSS